MSSVDGMVIIIENALNKCREINNGCENCTLPCAWREVGSEGDE